MPITVKFDPTTNSQQAQVIPDATSFSDGVMTKAQAKRVDNIGAGAGQFGTGTIVWQNGQTWAQVLPIIQAVIARHGFAQVLCDDGGSGNPFVIDAPANFDRVFLASPSGVFTMLEFTTDAAILGTRLNLKNLFVSVDGTLYASVVPLTVTLDGATMNPSGLLPIFALRGNAVIHSLLLLNGAQFGPGFPGQPSITLAQNTKCFITATNQALIGTGPPAVFGLEGAATHAQVSIFADPFSYIDKTTGLVPAGGAITVVSNPIAGDMSNWFASPGNPADWNPQPVTFQEQLDRMAALLKTLNGGNPIP